MVAVLINVVTIIIGSIIGFLLKKAIPQKLGDGIMIGMALVVMYIGISGVITTNTDFVSGELVLVLIFSFFIAAIVGNLLDLDKHLNNLGKKVEDKFALFESKKQLKNPEKATTSQFAKSFVTSTLLFCVGAMAVVGSLKAGIENDSSIIIAKAIIDGISACVFAATLGIGVMFSVIPLFIYQGGIVLLSSLLAPVLSSTVITEMSIAGSILIIVLSLNMLKVTQVKIMNYIFAIFLPIGLCPLYEYIFSLL